MIAVAGELAGEQLEGAEQAGPVRVRQHQAGDRLAAAEDETLTTRPKPRSRMPGTTSSINAMAASTSSRCAASHCSRVKLERAAAGRSACVGHEDVDRPEVALDRLDQAGRGVQVDRVVHVAAHVAVAPARLDLRGGRLDLLPLRELIATRAPSSASSFAIPKPMPCDAPVTRATFPSRPRSISAQRTGPGTPFG